MIVQVPPADPRRRAWLALVVLVVVVVAGFQVGRRLEAGAVTATPGLPGSAAPGLSGSAAPGLPASEAPGLTASAAPGPAMSAPPRPVLRRAGASSALQEPGRVPSRGSGTFAYAGGRGAVLGAKGSLRRFRVAAEKGSGADPAVFAAEVEAVLGDPRSWIGGGTLRLRRVSGADPADFTVYLATRDTAGRMCARGGTNIRVGGRPYTSCRTTGAAIINLDRWRLSAGPYLAAGVPLATYRQYVLNHEVGHELGHRHQGCPKAGGPAPVMVQQTLTLRGCVPYAWPRRGETFLTGPRR